jgi:hypothetical protein
LFFQSRDNFGRLTPLNNFKQIESKLGTENRGKDNFNLEKNRWMGEKTSFKEREVTIFLKVNSLLGETSLVKKSKKQIPRIAENSFSFSAF